MSATLKAGGRAALEAALSHNVELVSETTRGERVATITIAR